MPDLSDFLKLWKSWSIPAAIGAFAPWYEMVLAFPLISSYWQPELNFFCMFFGSFAAVIIFAMFRHKPKGVLTRPLILMIVLFVFAVLVCLVLQFTVGVTFFPSAEYQWLFWIVWFIAYGAIFVTVGATFALITLKVAK